MNKPIHPAVAEHVMEENEKLREVLRCIADLPMDRCSTENDYRLSAAKAIALGALSQQAEPTDTFTAVDMATAAAQGFRDGQAAVEQATAQDELAIDTAPLLHFIFSEYSSPEMAGRLPDDVVRVVRALEAGARPAQTEQQPVAPISLPDADSVVDALLPVNPNVAEHELQGIVSAVLFEVGRMNAAPIAQTAPHESEHHAQLLGQALGECIAAAGIIRPDASLNGPELLMFADDLKRHLSEQTAPQPEQSGLLEALTDAAQSLETISNGAGKDEFMQDMADVRGYARSRAGVARAALSRQAEPDDNVPDFVPGSGNKARRRMAAIALAAENQRVTPVEPLLAPPHPLAQQAKPAPAQDEREAEAAVKALLFSGRLVDSFLIRDICKAVLATRPAQTEPVPAQGEREAFENYMLDREHPVIGWIWTDWFKRGDDPETYANDYVQGAWVMWQARPAQTEQPAIAPDWLSSYEAMGDRLLAAGWRPEADAQWDGLRRMHAEYAAPIAQTAPQPEQSGLVEAASGALAEIQDALEDAYHNAYPECCGQAYLECCGSPLQAWSEADQKTMERFAPHEKALRAALSAQGARK